MNRTFRTYITFLFVLFFTLLQVEAAGKQFTIVIDAGHGGKDAGAVGSFAKEKNINLSVALALGQLIEKNHSDVRVVYTRKTDRFVELDERANIANKNSADLFISIHVNAVKKGSSVSGTETFTLGLARTDENLAVAMRENSAILLEDDYLQKYEGFNPNSTESYIIFEFMQNKHVEQSVSFASYIQDSFVAAKRGNRGVKQGGFLVLRKTSMPSVLIELGFISNKAEESFLASAAGQKNLTDAIYKAFVKYKNDYDRKQGVLGEKKDLPSDNKTVKQSVTAEKPAATTNPTPEKKDVKGKVVYKVQILVSEKELKLTAKDFKGYKNIAYYKEKGLYKYTCGETTDHNEIRELQRKLSKDFKGAFVVKFKDGQKVSN